jgi:hypothetical protein
MGASEIPTVRSEPFAGQNPVFEQQAQSPKATAWVPSRASVSVGRWLGRTRSEIKARLSSAYRRSRHASNSTMEKFRHEAHRIRTERPMQGLAVISGSAFALGLTLAILRSRRT